MLSMVTGQVCRQARDTLTFVLQLTSVEGLCGRDCRVAAGSVLWINLSVLKEKNLNVLDTQIFFTFPVILTLLISNLSTPRGDLSL